MKKKKPKQPKQKRNKKSERKIKTRRKNASKRCKPPTGPRRPAKGPPKAPERRQTERPGLKGPKPAFSLPYISHNVHYTKYSYPKIRALPALHPLPVSCAAVPSWPPQRCSVCAERSLLFALVVFAARLTPPRRPPTAASQSTRRWLRNRSVPTARSRPRRQSGPRRRRWSRSTAPPAPTDRPHTPKW